MSCAVFQNDLVKYVEYAANKTMLVPPQAVKVELYVKTETKVFKYQKVINSLDPRNWKKNLSSHIATTCQKLFAPIKEAKSFYADLFFKMDKNRFIYCYHYSLSSGSGIFAPSGIQHYLIKDTIVNHNKRPEPIAKVFDDRGNLVPNGSITEFYSSKL